MVVSAPGYIKLALERPWLPPVSPPTILEKPGRPPAPPLGSEALGQGESLKEGDEMSMTVADWVKMPGENQLSRLRGEGSHCE